MWCQISDVWWVAKKKKGWLIRLRDGSEFEYQIGFGSDICLFLLVPSFSRNPKRSGESNGVVE